MTRKWSLKLLASVFLVTMLNSVQAQKRWEDVGTEGIVSSDTTSKKGYTLIFVNKDPGFNAATKEKMTAVFFSVYPKEAKLYNSSTLKKVIIVIDPEYDGVAAAAGGVIRVNPEWMRKNPEDVDVVTHEVMHVVQSYPHGAGPGWVTEGIADYVRYKLGQNNEAANWKLPEYKSSQSYRDAYRVTARFFAWVEGNYNKKLVQKLDNAMRKKTYSESFWTTETGKSVDDLWAEYGKKPVLQ